MSKTVISNIFSNISATLINILAPLIIIPLLTSGLGMDDYGLYVALIAKTALFIVLTELGFGMYLAKEISVKRDDLAEVSSLFWVFLLTKLVAFVLVLAVFLLFSEQSVIVDLLLLALIFLNFINIERARIH